MWRVRTRRRFVYLWFWMRHGFIPPSSDQSENNKRPIMTWIHRAVAEVMAEELLLNAHRTFNSAFRTVSFWVNMGEL